MPDEDIRVSLEKEALEAYKEEYRDLVAAFQGLDGKAQGSVAIAGVFIGGIFAFLNSTSLVKTTLNVSILTTAVAVLSASVLLSILVLRVRDTKGVPTGEHTNQILTDLLELDVATITANLSRFYGDKGRAWASCVDKLRSDVERKSDFLWGGQIMLLLGIICVAFLAVLKVF